MTSLTCWMDAWQQLGIAGGSELYASVHAAYQEPPIKSRIASTTPCNTLTSVFFVSTK